MAHPDNTRLELVVDAEWSGAAPSEAPVERQPSTALAVRGNEQASSISVGQWSSRILVLEEVELPVALDPRLVLLAAPASARARSYRLLLHRLVAHTDPRVIAVTSAGPGEGKTTCAANLALALAEQSFSRVLLIDVNVRRPGLAQLFGFEPEDSFIDRLVSEGTTTQPYLVASLRGSRLHVAALRPDAPQGKRLDRLLLQMAIAELRYCYDYIVLDGASVLESADVDVACESADAVLLSARTRHSKKSALRRAAQQLSPAPLAGVVLLDA